MLAFPLNEVLMREKIAIATKTAMKAKNELELSTLRLMSTAIKSKDIDLRGSGGSDELISDEEIIAVLTKMVKQRRESAETYTKGKRPELAAREIEEIAVISQFLPQALSEDETSQAIEKAIVDCAATSIKDIGKVMAALKENYAGKMDFSKASLDVKKRLSEK